jgi:hypothetical protein
LVFKIDTQMKARRLNQVEAAALFRSRRRMYRMMLREDFRQLLRSLVALDQDVEILVKPLRESSSVVA